MIIAVIQGVAIFSHYNLFPYMHRDLLRLYK